MKHSAIILVLGLWLLGFSCVSPSRDDGDCGELDLALSLAGVMPNSALRVLQEFRSARLCSGTSADPDFARRAASSVGEEAFAKYCLAVTWALDKSGMDVADDSLIRHAYNYFRSRQSAPAYARAMYYTGKYYQLADSTERAEHCFACAASAAQEKCDTMTEMFALDRGSKLVKFHDLPRAEAMATRAADIYSQFSAVDSANLAWVKMNEGLTAAQCRHTDKGITACRHALRLAYALGDSVFMQCAHQQLSCVFGYAGQPDSALHHSLRSFSLTAAPTVSAVFSLADAYLNVDSARQALAFVAPLQTATTSQAYARFYHLFRASAMCGDVKAAVAYVDSLRYQLERLCDKELAAKTEYYQQIVRDESERARLEGISAAKSWLVAMVIVLALVIVAFLLYVLYSFRKASALRLQAAQERSRLELEHKDSQLKVMRAYILNKLNIERRIEEIRNHPDRNVELTVEEWHEIEMFLESASQSFVSRLHRQFPQLTERDVQLLMLLRLKMPSKIIAAIYGISEKSVKQKLFLYKSKVGLDGDNESLRKFIETF